MIFREATIADIRQLQEVRHSVKENILSNPERVTDQDCAEYLTIRGKGWVCELDGNILGFAIADLQDHNIWALFVRPEHEKMGIGKKLHDLMLDWYFSQTPEKVWLSTGQGTRAESFYQKAGWTAVGAYGQNETKFEMTLQDWEAQRSESYTL